MEASLPCKGGREEGREACLHHQAYTSFLSCAHMLLPSACLSSSSCCVTCRQQRGFKEGPAPPRPDLSKRSLSFCCIEPDMFVCEDTGGSAGPWGCMPFTQPPQTETPPPPAASSSSS